MNRRSNFKQCTSAAMMLCCSISTLAGESLLTPRLRLSTGYDANRLQLAENQESSAYISLAPGIDFVYFADNSTEWRLHGGYDSRIFSGGGGSQGTLDGSGDIAIYSGSKVYEVSIGAGKYTDSEIPGDDVRWLAFAPSAGWNITPDKQLYARLNLSSSVYDSRLTLDGDKETGTFIGFTPGYYMRFNDTTDGWIELYGENFTANEPVDEYRTIGIAAGLGSQCNESGRLNLSARIGYQSYPNDFDEATDRTAHPMRIAAKYTYRLTDWMQFDLAANWEQRSTTDTIDEYSQWLIGTGLTFWWERSLHSDRR
ncbi:MAG: hypothetical protein EOL87_03440 [Spartobacteria bacterium]|nr:hypothetical protein [Spartobacteria bacterium]